MFQTSPESLVVRTPKAGSSTSVPLGIVSEYHKKKKTSSRHQKPIHIHLFSSINSKGEIPGITGVNE
jgi:ribosome assembly protein YihI (activator of Der GTPase)